MIVLDIAHTRWYSPRRMGRLREETLNGAKWQMLQKITLQPLQLIFGMVLARLISPSEMGILALTAVYFAIAAQLASAGFGSALIRKIDRTEEDINTMFWFNAGMSLLLSLLLFAAAPWFAEFFSQPELVPLTRVSAGMMFLNSFASVHWTLYTCRRDFKTPALIQSAVAILSMPVCLTLAFMGWSFWSVVMQGVFSGVLNLVIVWKVSPWKPQLLFSWASFKSLFGFGSKLAASGLLFECYAQLRALIIGRFYTPADLGLYNRGSHLSYLLPRTLGAMVDSVTYPILATVQNDETRLLNAYRKYICTCTLVLAWLSLIVCAMAEPLVRIMYGELWLGCVTFVQILSLSHGVNHISVINLNLLKVKGRSDLFLRLEIIKRVISIGMLLYAASISVEAICWMVVIYTQIAIFINCYYTGKIVKLTWWQQQKDYLPYVLWAAVSVIPAWLIACLTPDMLFPADLVAKTGMVGYYSFLAVQLCVGVGFSLTLYLGVLALMKDSALIELLRCVAERPRIARMPRVSAYLQRLCSR